MLSRHIDPLQSSSLNSMKKLLTHLLEIEMKYGWLIMRAHVVVGFRFSIHDLSFLMKITGVISSPFREEWYMNTIDMDTPQLDSCAIVFK